MPRRCPSSIAAFSTARETCMYAFNDVAPWSAQKRTCRRASSVFVIACICRNVLVPFTYGAVRERDRKSTRLNSSHVSISYAVFCLKKKKDLCQDSYLLFYVWLVVIVLDALSARA